jgi:HPt (histidine-containing phosphotransfer) domain-containing protein
MSDPHPNADFDLSFLNEIADGSDEFIVESIDMFSAQTPKLLDEIGEGIATEDWKKAAGAAHKLKPNLGFFGMLSLQSQMQEIEALAKSNSPEPALLAAKFSTAKEFIELNLIKLAEIKAEKEG